MKEEIRRAAVAMLDELADLEGFAEKVREDAGWHGSLGSAKSQVSKWKSVSGPPMPLYAGLRLVRMALDCGVRDRLTPIWMRYALAGERDDEPPRRLPLRSVRTTRERKERHG